MKGVIWNFSFEGESSNLSDCKPIRYILEALKNPKKTIPYFKLKDIVSGGNKTIDINKDYSEMSKKNLEKEDLVLQNNILGKCSDIEESHEDMIKAFKALKEVYSNLSDGTPKDKKQLEKGVDYFKKTYKRDVYIKDGQLVLGADRNREYDNSRSLIGKAKASVLKDLKTKHPPLYKHLKAYLKMENGLSYNPPENFPEWNIK